MLGQFFFITVVLVPKGLVVLSKGCNRIIYIIVYVVTFHVVIELDCTVVYSYDMRGVRVNY